MSSLIEFFNTVDSASFFAGFIFCMLFDCFSSITSFFLEKAFSMNSQRYKNKKIKSESKNDEVK